MKMKNYLIAIFLFIASTAACNQLMAQTNEVTENSKTVLYFSQSGDYLETEVDPNRPIARKKHEVAYKKGKFYAFWGWNRGYYSNSDIHFKGDDYNFKLYDVKATDRPTDISYNNYIKIDRITIPQTNFKIGYFIKDNLAISVGVDHMKYVMESNQDVRITGNIAPYNGGVNLDEQIKLTPEFLLFEHTDGLNYLNVEVEYFYNLYRAGFFKLNTHVGAGGGVMYPKSNVEMGMFGKERHDDFNIAGFGTSVKLGLEVKFWDLFFLRTEGKEGFISMPNIRTSKSTSDSASQHFFFSQWNYTFGFSWSL